MTMLEMIRESANESATIGKAFVARETALNIKQATQQPERKQTQNCMVEVDGEEMYLTSYQKFGACVNA